MSAHPSETRKPTYNTAEIATRYLIDIDDEQKALKVDGNAAIPHHEFILAVVVATVVTSLTDQ